MFASFRSGGFGFKTQLLIGILAFAALAVAVLAAPWPPLPGGAALVALGGLVGLTVWTGLSIGWARIEDKAVHDTDRLAMYCAVLALGLAVMRLRAIRRAAPPALLLGIVATCVYALGGRLLPGIVDQIINSARLSQPFLYWNSLGLFAGFGVLIAVAIAGDESRPRLARSVACSAAVPCGLALFLTLSRGAAAATAVGLVVCLVARRGGAALLAAGCALGALVPLALALVAAFPETLSLTGDRDAQVTQGAVFLPIALAGTVAAGLLFARFSDAPVARARLPFSRRAQNAIAVAAVPLVLAAGIAISSSGTETTDVPQGAARISRGETNRGHYWRVALDTFRSHPVAGIGTGSFEAEFLLKRGEDEPALDAHSLYLETLMELGIVGALLLAVFVAGLAWGVGRAVTRAPSDPAVAPAAAVLAALAVHVGLDWDWEMPAVILPALVLAAGALRAPGVAGAPEKQQR